MGITMQDNSVQCTPGLKVTRELLTADVRTSDDLGWQVSAVSPNCKNTWPSHLFDQESTGAGDNEDQIVELPFKSFTGFHIRNKMHAGMLSLAWIMLRPRLSDGVNKPKLVRSRSVLADSPLLIAAKTNDTETLSELLLIGADVNSSAENGATAVYAAAEQNNVEALQILLERGADPNIALSGGCGFTPVYVASLRNNSEALTVLLRAGADPNVPICGMLRAMDIATRRRNTAAVAVLREYGGQTLRTAASA